MPEFKLPAGTDKKTETDLYTSPPKPYEELDVRPIDNMVGLKYGVLRGNTFKTGAFALIAIVAIYAFIYLMLSIPW